MSNNFEEVLLNIVCNNSTNITDTKYNIEHTDCNATTGFISDFSFRRCEVEYQPFVSMVNSIKKYFSTCAPQLLSQPEPREYLSHIEIFKNEAMGVEGIKYLVKSVCNFACDFTKKALEINLETPFSFLLTFVNNSIINNISLFEECPAAAIQSELFPRGTEMHLVFIDGNKVTNDTCIVHNISDNFPSYLPLHQQDPTSTPTLPIVLGFSALAASMSAVAFLINKYIDKANDKDNYSSVTTTNNSIASDLNNIIPFVAGENDQLPIIGELEEGVA